MSLFSQGSSPLLLTAEGDRFLSTLQPERLLLPSAAQRRTSDFLEPLSATAVEHYTALWTALRRRE